MGDREIEDLRRCLTYDQSTGMLRWNSRPREDFKFDWTFENWNSKWAGKEVDSIGNTGYYRFSLNYKRYLAHRAIIAMTYGYWPSVVDHLDGDKLNNRLSNLRATTQAVNMMNKSGYKNNTSGVTGVHKRKDNGKYSASVVLNGKRKHLGTFDTIEEAIRVREEELSERGFSSSHGSF